MPNKREQGVALVMVLAAISIMTIVLADMQESTSTARAVAVAQRDRLQAEYMAKSGLNLTRLLIAVEPAMTRGVAPMLQMLIGRAPHQLPVWKMADEVLRPFCNYEGAAETFGASIGLDGAEGLGDTPAVCTIVAVAENSKLNVSVPLTGNATDARRSVAMQLFALMGGYHSPSPYDAIFEQPDADGRHTSRLDVVSAMIDWWDRDTDRLTFDPGDNTVSSRGAEDDIYSSLDDPYRIKNAPFDSIEEVRLVRGVGDDFWATFVEPRPDDLERRTITVYGSGKVNVNEAAPEVILARLCSFLITASLCVNPAEAAKFIQLVRTVRALFPIPFFARSADFLGFIEGRGGPRDLYPMLRLLLGPNHPLLFTPVSIPGNLRVQVDNAFVFAARIITIESTGIVPRRMGGASTDEDMSPMDDGRATRVRIRAVVNFDTRWHPPPPNAGAMRTLGVIHYYRID